jgi:hypothetical protein
MYMIREMTDLSLPAIGEALGGATIQPSSTPARNQGRGRSKPGDARRNRPNHQPHQGYQQPVNSFSTAALQLVRFVEAPFSVRRARSRLIDTFDSPYDYGCCDSN